MSIEQFQNQPPTLTANFKPMLLADTRPAFVEASYAELVGRLDQHYRELVAFMTTPAVVRYSDLAGLRQRAISPDLINPSTNRCRAQLHLAADLLRLGRRREGFGLLQDLEDRLLKWEDRPRSLCYLLWIALLRATAGDRQGAFYLAFQITAQVTSPALDNTVAQFFRALHTPAAFLKEL
jgi:hypothetical protein